MSTNKKHKVSEKELDNLLGQAFLNLDFNNPKNQELMETISNNAMLTPNVSPGFFNKTFFTTLISIITIITVSTLIFVLFFKDNQSSHIIYTNNVIAPIEAAKRSIEKTVEIIEQPKNNISEVVVTKQTPNIANIINEEIKQLSFLNEPSKGQQKSTIAIPGENRTKIEDTSYVFPKLTEKEIKETKRQKEIMSMMLVKPNKYWYPLIGDPKQHKYAYGKVSDTSSVFYMARTEVTNLEYRTFLFDLLINGEKEAFLIAKPHQNLWLNAPGHAKGKEMKNLYFSDKRYNDFPVVNITSEGAELYCKWLGNIVEIANGKVIARLPYENEWIKAAKGKNVHAVYPWPGDSIQNKYGCHLSNFCIQKQSEKLRANMICKPKNNEAYASAEFMLGDSMMTCKVFSYNANDYGVYCLTGNVSEMVYENKTKSIITKGGSWNSDFEQCKIYNKEKLADDIKANPMTGFRPIFRINQNHSFGSIQREIPETGLQLLTSEETTAALKEKKKMIEEVIKLNKNKYALIPTGSCEYQKETISVQSFYMETTEVTNLEYKTFLADLLIQNKTAEYLIAKPNQQMWVTKFPYSFNEPMTNMYFWHPAYDAYPVVNITRKGAQLYCVWLTIETNKVLKESNKPLINDIRIPDELEWALAASNKKNVVKYANGNDLLKDSKGKYEVNYMCFSKEQCNYDSLKNLYIPKKELKLDKDENPGFVADGAFHTCITKAYNLNSYGLYCMAGNVSEMTINHKTNKPITKGGSWFSCDYFLEIDADDEYKNEINASPLIGFRPVFTAPKTK